MTSEESLRDKIITVIKKIVDTDPFFKHFEDYIKAVFIDHGDKFIVFNHPRAEVNMVGGFQYPNKIYINKSRVEKLIKNKETALYLVLRHELRHFIQCIVMIELCDDFKKAEECWTFKRNDKSNRLDDPLEKDVYLLEHGQDKTIEEFYDFIRSLIVEYRNSL